LRYRYDLGVDLDDYYPNAGLEEHFCRNYDNDPCGPWCFYGRVETGKQLEIGYCDVPVCELPPTASPSTLALPITAKPTVSNLSLQSPPTPFPTTYSPAYVCNADPKNCGCPNLF